MKSLNSNKVFFSVFRSKKDSGVNLKNHEYALGLLKREGIPYRILKGRYAGIEELSILLESSDVRAHEENLQTAIGLGRLFNQEAVLEVHNDNAAVLHRIQAGYSTDSVGTLTEVSKDEAKLENAYSIDPETGRCFVVR